MFKKDYYYFNMVEDLFALLYLNKTEVQTEIVYSSWGAMNLHVTSQGCGESLWKEEICEERLSMNGR